MVRVFFLTVLYEAQLVQNVTGWSRIVQNELCWYDLKPGAVLPRSQMAFFTWKGL